MLSTSPFNHVTVCWWVGAVIIPILQMRTLRHEDQKNTSDWELLCPEAAGLCIHLFWGCELSEGRSPPRESRHTIWGLQEQPYHFAEERNQDSDGRTALGWSLDRT